MLNEVAHRREERDVDIKDCVKASFSSRFDLQPSVRALAVHGLVSASHDAAQCQQGRRQISNIYFMLGECGSVKNETEGLLAHLPSALMLCALLRTSCGDMSWRRGSVAPRISDQEASPLPECSRPVLTYRRRHRHADHILSPPLHLRLRRTRCAFAVAALGRVAHEGSLPAVPMPAGERPHYDARTGRREDVVAGGAA